MQSGKHLKLPEEASPQFIKDLRFQAMADDVDIDIKQEPSGDGTTVDITWTVKPKVAVAGAAG